MIIASLIKTEVNFMREYDTPNMVIWRFTNDVITESGDDAAKGDNPFDYNEFN